MESQIIVLIPARFASTRFPGKPLAQFKGKEIILHVVDKARAVVENVFVATDDPRIAQVVETYGGQAILTGHDHPSGTDRCFEALTKIPFVPEQDAVIINLQGDEPFIPSALLTELANCFQDPEVSIATLVHPISDPEDFQNPNRVKVVLDRKNNALYFSRSPVPYLGNLNTSGQTIGYQHIGVYAFRLASLKKLANLKESLLEKRESLEQLRWLEAGYSIRCLITDYLGFGIDTPEDLILAEKISSGNEDPRLT